METMCHVAFEAHTKCARLSLLVEHVRGVAGLEHVAGIMDHMQAKAGALNKAVVTCQEWIEAAREHCPVGVKPVVIVVRDLCEQHPVQLVYSQNELAAALCTSDTCA